VNIQTTKFEAVPGTTFKIRVRPLNEEEKGRHCYLCIQAKADRMLEGRSVTRSDRKVCVPVCEKDSGVVNFKLLLARG
jgi:hypothetical protein